MADYFGNRYFGSRYFGPSYWGPGAAPPAAAGSNVYSDDEFFQRLLRRPLRRDERVAIFEMRNEDLEALIVALCGELE